MPERTHHYDTALLEQHVQNLVASDFSEKDLEILRHQLPPTSPEVREIDSYLAMAMVANETPEMVKLAWDGTSRTPRGLIINGIEIGGGKNGSSTDHSASVKSLGKASAARAYCARVVSVHIVGLRKFSQKPLNQRLRQASS